MAFQFVTSPAMDCFFTLCSSIVSWCTFHPNGVPAPSKLFKELFGPADEPTKQTPSPQPATNTQIFYHDNRPVIRPPCQHKPFTTNTARATRVSLTIQARIVPQPSSALSGSSFTISHPQHPPPPPLSKISPKRATTPTATKSPSPPPPWAQRCTKTRSKHSTPSTCTKTRRSDISWPEPDSSMSATRRTNGSGLGWMRAIC